MMCRLRYLAVQEKLPNTIDGYAAYWKKYPQGGAEGEAGGFEGGSDFGGFGGLGGWSLLKTAGYCDLTHTTAVITIALTVQ